MTACVQIIPQRTTKDCGVCCVAMFLGVSYEKALLAFGDVLDTGVTMRQIKAAAKKLGRPLTLARSIDLETDTGILALRGKHWPSDHVVVLREGVIVDTDATVVFDIDEFLAVHEARPLSLLK